MMKHFEHTQRGFFTLWLVAVLQLSPGAVAEQNELELEERYLEWSVDYVVNEDYTVESTNHFILQALTDNAARDLKRYSFSYSTSIETADIIDAYTLKSDGQKIEVPENNYQVNFNTGREDGGPVFSDRTRMTIVYPDLESGDSIVLTMKRSESEPMFPGEFSIENYFFDQTAYDSVQVTISMPAKLRPHMQVRGMKKRDEIKNGRNHIELTYSNPKPYKSDRKDFSVWERESQDGFAISSFDSYKEIARAYGERALPKAQPTKRVHQLASKILGRVKDSRKVARLLYDWVATNISYAGNCIGVGAVVPHDLDFILDNRMGDCKDHATLLQALYTSVGIESLQALINSGSSYTLPTVPMVFSVNHVITYIPEFDQFVDSTNPDMPFDTLGLSISDKPVLLVGNFKEGMRTPASQMLADWQKTKSTIEINSEGSASGNISVELAGMPATGARAIWRQLSQQQEDDWLESQFNSPIKKGTASIERDEPQPLSSEFSYNIDFQEFGLIPSDGAGGMYVHTPGYSPLPIFSYVGLGTEEEVNHDVACSNSFTIEELRYLFPDNLRILAVPEDLSLRENHIEFHASYELTDNALVIKRELRDNTPGNVCSAELMNAQRDSLKKIGKNLRSQVVFQYL